MGEWIAIVAIVCVFSVAGITWSMSIRAEMRARELLHLERTAAIEKGLPPPEEPVREEVKALPTEVARKQSPTHALGMGLYWSFLGVGFILAMLVVYPGTTRWGWGIILVALGLAHLVGHWLVRDTEADER